MLTFYKPNKSNKGSLLSVNFVAKADKFENGKTTKSDKCFYLNLVSQTGWDEKSRTGSFKDGKKIAVKIAPHEVSAMIVAMQKNVSMAEAMGVEFVYHDGDKTAATIYFAPHFKKIQKDGKWVDTDKQIGFGLRVLKSDKQNKDNKDQLTIGLTWAEMELLSLYLKDGLSHIFNALYSEDVSKFKSFSKKDAKEEVDKGSEEDGAAPEDGQASLEDW